MDVIYINNNLHIIKTYKWVSKLGMLGYRKKYVWGMWGRENNFAGLKTREH